jgi:aryl sulfotransferase
VRYQSPDEDSARWSGFPFRDGDIVISTRSKTGTTWVQMICALLIFQTPELPAPLAELSPWVDWLILPRERALHQSDNIDRAKLRQLTGQPDPDPGTAQRPRRPVHDRLVRFIDDDASPQEFTDGLMPTW